MTNKFESIEYNIIHRNVLDKTVLDTHEMDYLDDLKCRFQKNNFSVIIEDLYKFHKNNYTTSDLAEIFNVSTRRIQSILKELGMNRNKSEAQLIVVKKCFKDLSNTDLKRKLKEINPLQTYDAEDLFKSDYAGPSQLPERLEEFLNYLSVIRGRSENTINGYRIDLVMLFRFIKLYKKLCSSNMAFEAIDISDINDAVIQGIRLSDLYAFLSFVEKQRGNSAYARARKVASIKSFFKYLNSKTHILRENPASDLETPKINKRNPIYLTLDESKGLLEAVDENNKFPFRDFCIITLFLNCGLRLSELCGINISKIKEDTLTVIGKGNKERTVYLNKACLKAISEYLIERSTMDILPEYRDALFISSQKRRINKRSVELIVSKYIKAAELYNDKYSPHKLRHTAATLMYKYGNVDIRSLQQILGHENVSTTQIYTHVDDEKLREAVRLNPLNE